MFPYLFKRRCDSVVLFTEKVEVAGALAYIERKKSEGQPVTFFQLVILAMIRTLRERPGMNRFIAGRRLYQRKAVSVNFVAKQSFADNASESNVFIKIKEDERFTDILAKIRGQIKSVKQGGLSDDDKMMEPLLHLPRFVLQFLVWALEKWDFYVDTPGFLRSIDPLRCSVFLTNLGSIGVDAPYHHLFEWGNCSCLAAIGKIKLMPWVDESGAVVARRAVEINFTLDERIADGFYFAKSLELFEHYLKNPEELEKTFDSAE